MSKNAPAETNPLDKLMASVSHELVTVDVDGHQIPVRPVTILQCLRVVRKFPKLLDLFDAKVDENGEPLPPEQQPNLISILVDAGPEAVSEFVACAVGKEGDVAFRHWFAQAPDRVTVKLFAEAAKATLGDGGLDDFFSRLLGALADAGLIAVDQPESQPESKAA